MGMQNNPVILENSLAVSYKVKHKHGPAIQLPGIYLREMKTYVFTNTYMWMFIATLLSPKTGNNPNVHQPVNEWTNCGTSIWWNTTQQWKGVKHWYMQEMSGS